MPMQAVPSRIAALYERQDDHRHPMGWPALMLAAPVRALMPLLDAYDPSAATLTQKIVRGARASAANPMWLPLTAPGAMLLAGGMAPTVACGLMGSAALLWGGTGLQGTREIESPLGAVPHQGWGVASMRALGALAAYGILGCLTELPAAQLGRLGAQRRQSVGCSSMAQAVGRAAEYTGYSLALSLGALLTVGRLASAAFFSLLYFTLLAPAAVVGGLWALGKHLLQSAPQPRPHPVPKAPLAPAPAPA